MSDLLYNSREQVAVFFIVTPVYNGAEYIDETIYSVLSQSGPFEIRYHVQDGNSKDGTLDRVKRWQKLVSDGDIPIRCNAIQFTYTSELDDGMYDAINRGFRHILNGAGKGFMAWIASDDLIAPGAFSTVNNLHRQLPSANFLGGRISIIDQFSSIVAIHPVFPFSRRHMAAGLYDGRSGPFVMQEATFWSCELWRKVGGLDSQFKLAGDWDLWRRMSRLAPYVSVDSQLGFHRRRPGQLSEGISSYYAEIDSFISEENKKNVRSTTKDTLPFDDETNDDVVVVRYNIGSKIWQKLNSFGVVHPPHIYTPREFLSSVEIIPGEGLSGPEIANDELCIPNGCRWMITSNAKGKLLITDCGAYIITIVCRSWTPDQSIVVTVNDVFVARIRIVDYGNTRNIEVRAEHFFNKGSYNVGLYTEQPSPTNRPLLIMQWYVEAAPSLSLFEQNVCENDRIYNGVDGAVGLIDGFGLPEGPYPEHGLNSRFCWALGDRSTVTIFSNLSGVRILELRIRNVLVDQKISVTVDGETILSQTLEFTSIGMPIILSAPIHTESGLLTIVLSSSKQMNSPSDPRRLAFVLEKIGFAAECETLTDTAVIANDRIDGTVDLVRGVEPWIDPRPDNGIAQRLWRVLGGQGLLQIFSAISGQRQLEFKLRGMRTEGVVSIRVSGGPILSRVIPGGTENIVIIIRVDVLVNVGWVLVDITSNKTNPALANRIQGDCFIESVRFC